LQLLEKEKEYQYFKKKVFELTQIDLNSYKTHQIQRRLPYIIGQAGVEDYISYVKILENDPIQLKRFVDWVTINVSEFFRDLKKFEELRDEILPHLLRKSPRLKIWSAGCSNGAEPYTIAIILDELTPGLKHKIIATDLDEKILDVARNGRYPMKELRNVVPRLLNKFFVVDGDEAGLKGEIKERVDFKKHDLFKDEYETNFDLIICRNVVIYFTEESKCKIYRKFYDSLKAGGLLFTGSTESLMGGAAAFGFEMFLPFFYLKPSK